MPRRVLITGASRGLGAQLMMEFVLGGAEVIGLYKTHDADVQALQHQMMTTHPFLGILKADVRSDEDIQKVFQYVESKWGKLDLLINNAAITRDQSILKMSSESWEEVLDINLKGALRCIRGAIPFMTRSKEDLWHKMIINIVSLVGLTGGEGQSNYAASKAGLISLTQVAAMELGSKGIQVNAVLPGLLKTVMSQGTRAERKNEVRPLKEIAQSIVFISNLRRITGEVFMLEDRSTSYADQPKAITSGRYGYWPFNINRDESI